MNHITGEIRCYVGGRYELVAYGEEFAMLWIPGKMVCKARYSNKGNRTAMINKMIETWGDIEVAIMPDDIEAVMAEIEEMEKELV